MPPEAFQTETLPVLTNDVKHRIQELAVRMWQQFRPVGPDRSSRAVRSGRSSQALRAGSGSRRSRSPPWPPNRRRIGARHPRGGRETRSASGAKHPPYDCLTPPDCYNSNKLRRLLSRRKSLRIKQLAIFASWRLGARGFGGRPSGRFSAVFGFSPFLIAPGPILGPGDC